MTVPVRPGRAVVAMVLLSLGACSGGTTSTIGAAPTPVTRMLAPDQVAVIDVGRDPTQVAVGAGSAWIGNSGDGTLSQLDATSNRLLRTISIGATSTLRAAGCAPGTVHSAPDGSYAVRRCDVPSAVVFASGSLWVTQDDRGALLRMDPATRQVEATIALGIRPFLMTAGMGSIWVTDYEHDAMARVDIASNTLVKTFRGLRHGPSGVAVGAGGVWVADRRDNSVTRIDPATNTIAAVIPVGSSPLPIVASDAVYVKEEYGGAITRIDPASNRVVGRLAIGPKEGRDGVDSIALDGPYLWVTGMRLEEIDTRSSTIVRSLAQDASTVSIDGAGGLWVTDVAGRVVRVKPAPL